MIDDSERAVKTELDRLTTGFFRAVSFEEGATPRYEDIQRLFIEPGLLIKNTASTPEISTVAQFIEPRIKYCQIEIGPPVGSREQNRTEFHAAR